LVGAASLAAFAASHATAGACVGAGVITRIDGDPAAVNIVRDGAKVSRPRVLEVVCSGDQVAAAGATQITLSIDGKGVVKVGAGAPYLVATRSGAPSLAGNAYRAVSDQVMPDMKRLPWDVRLKGGDTSFAFALPQLASGGQQLSPGPRALLLRVTGGTGPYAATVTGPGGAVQAQASGQGDDLVFSSVNYAPGKYHVSAHDGSGVVIQADFTVADKPATLPTIYDSLTDPEVRAAATAAALARADSPTHALEAEQLLAAAPSNGLDRGRVYDLIESYGAD
jgi:hypothetical protein